MRDTGLRGTTAEPDGHGAGALSISRRDVLRAAGVLGAGLVVPAPLWLRPRAAGAAPAAGAGVLRLAMHVHGSWSEGAGSWEAQCAEAIANGIDVLYLTDHDHRATARNYLTSLAGVTMLTTRTGVLSQQVATCSGGAVRLVAESASTTVPAQLGLALQPRPDAFNRLRTSVAGQVLLHRTTAVRLGGGARYEVVVPLSLHPAGPGRPAGQFTLVYRFGATARVRFTEDGGLTGVVPLPAPARGTVQRLSPETDIAALWPSMRAVDNVMYGLELRVKSPRRGAVADIAVAGVEFLRTQSTPTAVSAQQAALVAAYGAQFPGLTLHATSEISLHDPHLNAFGIPQWFPDYDTLPTDEEELYRAVVGHIHAQNGLVSWNHPFGYNTGPLLGPAERDAKRRSVFEAMADVEVFGVDLLEVGYGLRGSVDAATHLALWDTFSRGGVVLTGNGTTDDHSGQGWAQSRNGFCTGVWVTGRTDPAVLAALASGRAFFAHSGAWPGGRLDMAVDGRVPMGAVSVSSLRSRSLTVAASPLPVGGALQVVAGPVDESGASDPATRVLRTWTAAACAGRPVTIPVDTSSAGFYRAQVLSSAGVVVGGGNPIWLLTQDPERGVPAARRVARR